MGDTKSLYERCLALNLPGAASLAEHWSSPEQADLIGTYLKYYDDSSEADPIESILSGQTFSIQVGPFKSGEKPIDWLEAFIAAIESNPENLPNEGLRRFDKACADHVLFVTAPLAGPVTRTNKNGTFIIPPESYKKHMTQGELEPFLVPKDDPRLDW
jgi:hypothetical protein